MPVGQLVAAPTDGREEPVPARAARQRVRRAVVEHGCVGQSDATHTAGEPGDPLLGDVVGRSRRTSTTSSKSWWSGMRFGRFRFQCAYFA